MKKLTKRVISLLLAGVMAFGLCACGGSDDAAKKEEAKKYVFRMEDMDVDILDEEESTYGYSYADGRIYILTTRHYWEELTGVEVNLVSVNEDGSDVAKVELFSNVKENPNYVPFDEESPDFEAVPLDLDMPAVEDAEPAVEESTNDIFIPADEPVEEGAATEEDAKTDMEVYSDCYVTNYSMDKNGVVLVMESNTYGFDEMGNYQDLGYSLELYSYDLSGNLKFSTMLNDNMEEYVWYRGITSDAEGNLVLVGDEEITLLNSAGELLTKIDMTTEGYVSSTFIGRDGKLWLISYNDEWTKMFLKKFDFTTEKFEDEIELLGTLTNYNTRVGMNYDFLLTNSQGIYAYNVGDTEVTPLLNYINSDIDGNNINQIFEAEDGKLVCVYMDEETWENHLAMLTPVAPEDVPDKEVITLACNYLDYRLRKYIVEFNRTNTQYRVTVTDYSVYNTPEDYTAGATRLNNDILSGNIPDIMVFDGYSSQMNNFIAKGILTDIGKLIEEDETMNMDDYMTNVFEAYSVDGKLYSVVPNFSIQTVIGKTKDVGETPGWTLDDLKALMAANPDVSVFGDTITRSEILSQLMMYSGSHFVDSSTGKCHFDSEEFIEILEFAAQFPETFDWENVEDDYWISSETQYRDGRTLLMSTGIYEIRDYNRTAKGYFGEDVTPIGFPTTEGNGSVIIGNTQYGISSRCKNMEGAWEFLKYFLSEEYQTSDEFYYSLPVLKSALEAKLEEAQERPYWEWEDGTKEYYDDTWWIGDQEIILEPMTEAEAQELYDFISSVNKPYSYDEALMNIITEEVAPYFEGHKSAEEVVTIIQSRAQVYVNENR